MKRIITTTVLILLAGVAQAQTAGSQAVSNTRSDSGAFAGNTNVFEAAEQRKHSYIHSTPDVIVGPSMFGQGTCGRSNTFGGGVAGIGIGGSIATDDPACDARADTSIAAQFGLMDVAKLRFFCFGTDDNRMAFEAAGYSCPSSGTAKGIEGAPVGPKFLVAASVAHTMHGRINSDGTVTYER